MDTLQFQIMFGLQSESDFPDGLKEILESHIEENAKIAKKQVNDSVKKYFAENPELNAEVHHISTTIKKVDGEEISKETTSEDLSFLPEGIRDRIKKGAANNSSSKNELKKRGVSKASIEEIDEICAKITDSKDSDTKSLLSYDLVTIRTRVKEETVLSHIAFDKETEELEKRVLDKVSDKRKDLIYKSKEIHEKSKEALKACLEDLKDIHLMDKSEFSKLSLEDRFNYIKHIATKIDLFEDKTNFIIKKQKKDMLKVLQGELGIDQFISAALGNG